ncbi:MAG: hypothetical protein AB2693_33155, partial [Candidatus Thiodiazotropha sp.]
GITNTVISALVLYCFVNITCCLLSFVLVEKKMAHKDFFAELDPLSQMRNWEPQTPIMPQLSRVDTERLDESHVEAFQLKESKVEQLKEDMHLMFRMLEDIRQKDVTREKETAELREEMRQRDSCREKEMHLLMQKLTELTTVMTDKKPQKSYEESKLQLAETEPKQLAEPVTQVKKEQSVKTVHWKDTESVEKKTENTEHCQKEIIIKPTTFTKSTEQKDKTEQNKTSSEHESVAKTTEKNELGSKSRFIMKPATFDGSTSWIDYRSHFDMCAELNGWTNQQKGLYLGVSLRGLAQGVLGNLPAKDQKDFEALSKALSERFSPESQTELYRAQLKEREWKHGENLAEFGQRILRLTTLAYPKAEPNLINVLSMGFFVDSISDAEMRLKIQQTRPKDLNEAVKVAIELEAFDRAERQRRGQKYARQADAQTEGPSELKKIAELIAEEKKEQKEDLQKIIEQVIKLTKDEMKRDNPSLIKQDQREVSIENNIPKSKPNLNGKPKKKCFICGNEDHLANTCPKKPKCYVCHENGHKSYECPRNKNKSDFGKTTVVTKQPMNKKTVKRAGHPMDLLDSGMYCHGVLHGIGITALIDSGATATMISDAVYNKLPQNKSPVLNPVECR